MSEHTIDQLTVDQKAIEQLKAKLDFEFKKASENSGPYTGDPKYLGVHETHCCVLHGCKYGNDDCPVVNGQIKQTYQCEGCRFDLEEIRYHILSTSHLDVPAIADELKSRLIEEGANEDEYFADKTNRELFFKILNSEIKTRCEDFYWTDYKQQDSKLENE